MSELSFDVKATFLMKDHGQNNWKVCISTKKIQHINISKGMWLKEESRSPSARRWEVGGGSQRGGSEVRGEGSTAAPGQLPIAVDKAPRSLEQTHTDDRLKRGMALLRASPSEAAGGHTSVCRRRWQKAHLALYN